MALYNFLSYIIIFIIVLRLIQFFVFGRQNTINSIRPRPIFTNRRGGINRMHHPRPFPFRFGQEQSSEDQSTKASSSSDTSIDIPIEYEASPADIWEVKKLLMTAGNLPLELADIIIDQAEYWACSSVTADYSGLPRKILGIRGGQNNENTFLIRTDPLGLSSWTAPNQDSWRSTQAVPQVLREEFSPDRFQEFVEGPQPVPVPARKIVFKIRSSDQGWGGIHSDHGTYRHSWTWFDAGLERFDADAQCDESCPLHSSTEDKGICSCTVRPVWPTVASDEGTPRYAHDLLPTEDHKIQANKVAVKGMQQHHVEWRWNDDVDPDSSAAEDLEKNGRGKATGNGEFVRSIKLGDIITVWGRARFGGWENRVEKIEVKVYWAV